MDSRSTDSQHETTPSSHELWWQWFNAIRAGDLEQAWAVRDAVLAAQDPRTRNDPREPPHKRWVWDGRALDGRDVLVRCYHGLGDTLQFARFLPLLRERARSVTVEVQPRLIPLLRMPGIDLIPFRPEAPTPSDCDIEIMELAHALRAEPWARQPPYLSVPDDRIPHMQARRRRVTIGLCWRGGDWSGRRSLPLADLASAIPKGIALFNLQGDDRADDARASGLPFLNPDPFDISDAAAAVAVADLVISVDTMIAHLAGALARPTWLLVPADCDWRWTRGGDRSEWYPSMRLYRQTTLGEWSGPIARLGADLTEWAAAAAAP